MGLNAAVCKDGNSKQLKGLEMCCQIYQHKYVSLLSMISTGGWLLVLTDALEVEDPNEGGIQVTIPCNGVFRRINICLYIMQL